MSSVMTEIECNQSKTNARIAERVVLKTDQSFDGGSDEPFIESNMNMQLKIAKR
jgi:hypothetical protein